MSDRPASEMWQYNVPPHPSCGGWACIMTCLCHLRSSDAGDGWRKLMATTIAKHGEPPRAFAAAWLADKEALYSWLAWKQPSEYHEWWCWAVEGVRSHLGIPRGADIPFTKAEIDRALDAWFSHDNPPTSNTCPPHSERMQG